MTPKQAIEQARDECRLVRHGDGWAVLNWRDQISPVQDRCKTEANYSLMETRIFRALTLIGFDHAEASHFASEYTESWPEQTGSLNVRFDRAYRAAKRAA